MTTPRMAGDMGLVHRAGARIAWFAEGAPSLPALVLGNSLGTDHTSWDTVVPRLRERFRVIRFDARGHGASRLDDASRGADYSMEMLAQDTLAVADAAGATGRFHYLGLSIGGMIGMWLAQHAAHRLDRLVLSNTAAKLPADVWEQRIAAVRAAGMPALVDATLQRWFTPAFHARGDALIAHTREVFLQVDTDGYVGCAAAIRDMQLEAGLPRVHAPTLVLTGSLDPSTPTALGQEIAARIPGARWAELPVAHIPQLEQPAAFAEVVEGFLLAR